MKTFFSKILLGNILLIFLLLSTTAIFSTVIIKKYYQKQIENSLSYIAYGLVPLSKTVLNNESTGRIIDSKTRDNNSLLNNLAERTKTRITLIDKAGKVLFDTDKDPLSMDNHLSRQEIQQALAKKEGFAIRYSNTVKKNMLYKSLAIFKDSFTENRENLSSKNILGFVRVSKYIDNMYSLFYSLLFDLLKVVVIFLGFAILLAIIFSKKITYAIKKLALAMKKLKEGDLKARVQINTGDELDMLAKNFNETASEIEELFLSLKQEKEYNQSILSSLEEGVLVIDLKSDKILTINDSLRKNLNIIKDDTYYWQIIADSFFDKIVKEAKKTKNKQKIELNLAEKTYLLSISFKENFKHLVCIFHDITDIKAISETKKNLISNASHELKTPLTAIKGFIETLEDEQDEKNRKLYLNIIKKHTERLIYIINDLLVLSDVENKVDSENDKNFEILDLKEIIRDTLIIFKKRIFLKNLALKLNLPDNESKIYGDRFQLEQILINLIDNAIKYTEEGAIEISLKNHDRKIILIIKDTGAGIPEKSLPHIFERFYVVDKSRSRETGGTGLGLSIVKHIISLHGGEIQVSSVLGEGTSFIVELKNDK